MSNNNEKNIPLWIKQFIRRTPKVHSISGSSEEKTRIDSVKSGTMTNVITRDNRNVVKEATVNSLYSCEDTVISKEAEINGSITSRGNITVNGKIKGNVVSDANVKITGSVEGDINGKSVDIKSGKVIGNITSKTSLIISDKSAIKGDISCDKLDLNGEVNGNSQVYTTAMLGKEAVIRGDLTSQNLSIQEGAIVNGSVKVNKEKEQPVAKSNILNAQNELDSFLNQLTVNSTK